MPALCKPVLNQLRYTALAAAFPAILACGAADSVRAVPEEKEEASIRSEVNTCPTFAFYMVLPKTIREDEQATAIVFATDVDSDDTKLSYVWSATAGEFTEPEGSLTKYSCASRGPQVLSVTTRDPDGCESVLTLDVDCLAP